MNADTNILAAVAEHAGAPFTLERVELGDCRADEVVVDIRAVGICHTDLLARAGAFPTPLPAVKIPTDIPFHVAAPFGCGIQTGAGAVLNAFDAPPGSTLAVFGTGGVGMAAIMAARHAGCSTIIGVDRSADRLTLAAKLGALAQRRAARRRAHRDVSTRPDRRGRRALRARRGRQAGAAHCIGGAHDRGRHGKGGRRRWGRLTFPHPSHSSWRRPTSWK